MYGTVFMWVLCVVESNTGRISNLFLSQPWFVILKWSKPSVRCYFVLRPSSFRWIHSLGLISSLNTFSFLVRMNFSHDSMQSFLIVFSHLSSCLPASLPPPVSSLGWPTLWGGRNETGPGKGGGGGRAMMECGCKRAEQQSWLSEGRLRRQRNKNHFLVRNDFLTFSQLPSQITCFVSSASWVLFYKLFVFKSVNAGNTDVSVNVYNITPRNTLKTTPPVKILMKTHKSKHTKRIKSIKTVKITKDDVWSGVETNWEPM